MNMLKFYLPILFFASVISGCYVDNGQIMQSSIKGYDMYTNKTINVSVLTPKNWKTKVTIGGQYTIKEPASDEAAFYIDSQSVKLLMGEKASESITLEEFKNYRAAQVNEENMDPEFDLSINKSTLSGYDAYEFLYSYSAAGLDKNKVVQETFTLAKGRVYRICYYANEDTFSKYQKELHVIKDSYSIL